VLRAWTQQNILALCFVLELNKKRRPELRDWPIAHHIYIFVALGWRTEKRL
jgi:hypothetical protein